MRLQQTILRQKTFRFRRWSRKGYAAFFSLCRTVTIGQLSSYIAERFQTKNGSNHLSVFVLQSICPEELEKEANLSRKQSHTEIDFWLSQTLLSFAPQTVKQTSAADSLAYITLYILSGMFQQKLKHTAFSFY